MATAVTPDIAALQREIEQLRVGLDAAAEKMRALSGEELPNGRASALAEKTWTEVKRQAQQVGHEIEERPLVTAATAFGAGIALGVLGVLFGSQRGAAP